MIREAGPQDRGALEAFFLTHIDIAMFPMANLRNHGIATGNFPSAHPNATRFWLFGPGIAGVVAVTQRGMVMAVLPNGGDLSGLHTALAGLVISGAVGERGATRAVLAALGLAAVATRRDADEPSFALQLADLTQPPGADARLVALDAASRDIAVRWRRATQIENMGMSFEDASATAERDIDAYIPVESHRILLVGGVPVAMTGFNAALPEIVQVGGVYVPPDLRGRGYARLAVALHLIEARAQGVARAVLFAANEPAARAYRAIGFQLTGAFALVLFDGVHEVRP